MRELVRTAGYAIRAEFEDVEVVGLRCGTRWSLGDHYGDASCAVITPDERWFVSGGYGITCRRLDSGILHFFRPGTPPVWPCEFGGAPDAAFVRDLRVGPDGSVLVLVDPWSEFASIWRLGLDPVRVDFVQRGPDLRGTPYSERDDIW